MKKFLLGLTILLLSGIQPSLADSKSVSADQPAVTQAAPPPAHLTTIFSNLGKKYPNSVYYCCAGIVVSGPNNTQSAPEQWYAVKYTPSVNFTLERIQLAVGYFSGTNNVAVAVYSNSSSNLPDTQLGAWHVSGMPANGSCCLTETASVGIALTSGTPYWIVLKTISSDKDSLVFWERNTTDQVNGMTSAFYCSMDHQGSCSPNDQWIPAGSVRPAPAFALLGE